MSSKDEERAARLKAALRDNLKRRKAQARGRAEPEARNDQQEPRIGDEAGKPETP